MWALIKNQWMALSIIAAVILAFIVPEWGMTGGLLKSELTSKLGIVLIFFFQGWVLPTEVLIRSVLNWKAHIYIQAFIFLLFPGLIILGDYCFGSHLPEGLRIGFYFLAALPTTITMANIYTAQSEGNTALSLFNTTLANVAGVFITPLLLTVLLNTNMGQLANLGAVLLELSQLILLPLFLGQVAHYFFKHLGERYKKQFSYFNQLAIVFIVFSAFSNSVVEGVWSEHGWGLLAITLGICLFLFALITMLSWFSIRGLKFALGERIATYFCVSHKTLAMGAPMGISLFGGDPLFGLILLPLLVYHSIQLLLGAFFIARFRQLTEQ